MNSDQIDLDVDDVLAAVSGQQFDRINHRLRRSDWGNFGNYCERLDGAAWRKITAGAGFYRLRRHSRFWNDETESLVNAFTELVTGLHDACAAWFLVVNGIGYDIECWYGMRPEPNGGVAPDVSDLLRGALRDLPIEQNVSDAQQPDAFDPFEFAFRLTGTPTAFGPKQDLVPLDRLCRGLLGGFWQFIVCATPWRRDMETHWANRWTSAIDSVRFAGDSRHDEKQRERVIQLMEPLAMRPDSGGLWDISAWLSARERGVAARGAALLTGSLNGKESLPDPVRLTRAVGTDSHPAGRALKGRWPVSSRQLAVMVCPPARDYPGYEIIPHAAFAVQSVAPSAAAGSAAPLSKSLEVGKILVEGRQTGNALAIPLDDLTSHALVVGITGSGKTNTCFRILAQLAEHQIPFLVIESAKSEYRELLSDPHFAGSPPRILTVANEQVAPLRLNPFAFPSTTLVQTHIDYLKQAFSAAFAMWQPLPHVLERSLEEIYIDRGWDLTTSTNNRADAEYAGARQFPTLDDLETKARQFAETMDYSSDVRRNIIGGLVSRLGQLRGAGGKGPMFNTRASISDQELFERPCIIELKSLVSDDEKAFFIGLLLIRLVEYRESQRQRGIGDVKPGKLRHVTLIEEAHRLLRNVPQGQSTEVGNPKGQAIEFFSNLLAEIRAYGEGIVMAEQIPVKLVPDAIKNTNLKVVHRLLSDEDRRVIGATMNLNDKQIAQLARLQRGQAVTYAERLADPVLAKVELLGAKEQLKFGEADLPRQNVGDAAAVGAMLAAIAQRDTAGYRALIHAFQRLFNLMRALPSQPEPLRDLFEEEIADHVRMLTGAAGIRPAVVLDVLLDREIEARAAFRQPVPVAWPFARMDSIIGHGRTVIEALSNPQHNDEELAGALTGFAQALAEAHAIPPELGPVPGCVRCVQPCSFLFDVTRESGASPSPLFANALTRTLDPDDFEAKVTTNRASGAPLLHGIDMAPWTQLAIAAIRDIKAAPMRPPTALVGGMAYCYALQHLSYSSGKFTLPPSVRELGPSILAHIIHSAGDPTAR